MKNRQMIFRLTAFAVVCLGIVSTAHAQLETGTISGTVQDATGAVIPGVVVSLLNPGTIGGNQQTTTDERGVYRFTRLVPGIYVVSAELPGFRTARREAITVNADVTVRVDMTLQVGDVADTVTVTGEAPLLDTTTALNQAVLDRRTLDTLPTGNDVWSIARLVPALLLDKYDVGGSESFQQSSLSVHGSPNSERKFAIDGLDVAVASGNLGNYLDTHMFQELNYQVSSISAENQQGGVVINMVTKTGSNEFRGTFSFIGTNQSMQGDNLTPDLRRDLSAAIPSRVLQANPGLEPRTKILGMFDGSLTLSGPILRDRLWFSASGNINSLNQLAVGSYNADGTQSVDDNRIKNAWLKLSGQINSNNQLHWTYNRNYKDRYHRRSQPFTEDRASHAQIQDGFTTLLKWTSNVSNRVVTDAMVGYNVIYFPTQPQREVRPGDMSRFDIVTQTLTVAAPTYAYAPTDRGSVSVSASYFSGKHDLKWGYQYTRAMGRNVNYSMSHYPSGLQARFRNGVPDSVNLYSTPNDSRVYYRNHGFFIQDKWTPIRKLTLNLGLRFENVGGWVPAQCQPAGAFVQQQCFNEIRNVPDWFDLSPRFGLAYDVFGDGRTAFKLSISRYNINLVTSHQLRVNPVTTATDTRPWTDRNRDLIPQLDELGPGTGFDFAVFNRYNPDVKRPYNNEYSVALQQEVAGNIVLSASYFHRDVRRNIGARNVAVPRETYIPTQVTEVNSGRQVIVYNLAPALRTARDILFDNFSELDTLYNGVDLTFNKKFSNRWMVMGGLTIGATRGDTRSATTDLNDPNFTFRRGRLSNDVPVSFKLSGTYQLPFGVSVSGNFQHFTGFPEPTTVLVTRASVPGLTRTSQAIEVEPRSASRLPEVNMADISFKKMFRFAERITFEPALDIFNAGNSAAIQGRVTQLGPAYRRVSSILAPRFVRIGFKVDF
ncbi:MAG: TonB-dependent receptor [Acidobacteria bacterium]|nr:TonB-dependent receptor [Acidobacteriota bacterium]